MNVNKLEQRYQAQKTSESLEAKYQESRAKKNSIVESIGRVAGATVGSMVAFPVSGIAGFISALPESDKASTPKPGSGLGGILGSLGPIELEKGAKRIEQVMSFPSMLIQTDEEKEAIEDISILMKPFEMAGEGWGLIAQELNKGVNEIIGTEIPYLEPILETVGEASAMLAAGEIGLRRPAAKVARGLSARNVETRVGRGVSKYGAKAEVPSSITPSDAPAAPVPLETPYLQDSFNKKFNKDLQGTGEPTPLDVKPSNEGLPVASQKSKWEDLEYSYLNSKNSSGISRDETVNISPKKNRAIRSKSKESTSSKSVASDSATESRPSAGEIVDEAISDISNKETEKRTSKTTIEKDSTTTVKENTNIAADLYSKALNQNYKEGLTSDAFKLGRDIYEGKVKKSDVVRAREEFANSVKEVAELDRMAGLELSQNDQFFSEALELNDLLSGKIEGKEGKVKTLKEKGVIKEHEAVPPETAKPTEPIEIPTTPEESLQALRIRPLEEYSKQLKDPVQKKRFNKIIEKTIANENKFEWENGAQVKNSQTGDIIEIVARSWDDVNDQPVYMYKSLKGKDQGAISAYGAHDTYYEIGKKTVDVDSSGNVLYSGLPYEEFGKMYTKYIGEPLWDNLIMTKVPKVIEKFPGGKSVNRALLYDYRGDLPDTPLYMANRTEMLRNQKIGRIYGINLGRRLQAMPERSQLVIGDRLRGKNVDMLEYEGQLAIEARNALDSLGKQAVDAGLLSEKVFFENVGKYMPRLYTSKEYRTNLQRFGIKKPNQLEMSRFKKRKDIPKEVRKELGEILTPGYPVAKGIIQLTHDIELANHFNFIAKNPKWAMIKEPILNKKTGKKIPYKKTTYNSITGEPIIKHGVRMGFKSDPPAGWKQLPKNDRLGTLSEAYVHPEIARDIDAIIKIRTKGERIWRSALGKWKFGKVILSPKTHFRNVMSNSLLSHLGGMPLYRQPFLLTKAAKELRTKGKYWQQAMDEGLLGTTYVEGELRALFDGIDLRDTKVENIPESLHKVTEVWDKAKKGAHKAADLYQAEEEWFKLAKYIDNVERRGMTPKEAAADSSKWLFDYGKLTPAQEAYRSKWYGAPFATFTIKAIPRMAEAVVKTPWRFALPFSMIYAMEEGARAYFGDTKEQAAAKEKLKPEWMKGEFLGMPNFPRVAVVDDFGREYYMNLSFIVPWGDLAETGDVGPIPGGVVPFSQPFVKEAWQQLAGSKGLGDAGGYDTFWKEPIVKESDVAGLPLNERRMIGLKKRGRHLYNTMVPTLAIDIEKGIDALQGNPDFRGRERPTSVVAADVLLGFKMYPVDYADRIMQEVFEGDPNSSPVARRIHAQIKSLAARRNQHIEKGNDRRAKELDKEIALKIRQLQGLGKELSKKGAIYKQTQGETQ